MISNRAFVLALLALMALLPYLPMLFHHPFISDDYIQIHLGRIYGPVEAWAHLAADPLYRCRATSIVLTYWTEMLFGVVPLAFYATSIALHVTCCWMVWLCARRLGFAEHPAMLGAAFFGLYEGHQEAVMWYASLPELLLFLFCAAFLLCWIRWVDSSAPVWYAAALLQFAMALLSKEPGVVLVPVAGALLFRQGAEWRRYLYLLPLVLASGLYAWGIFEAKRSHLHLNDGTFSLQAPFILTWARSMFRMLWFWGLLAFAWLAFRRRIETLLAPVTWMALTLLPYCFLIYMPHVPSRHVYLASAGLALIVGLAVADIPARRWALGVMVAILLHNTGYVWTRKRAQFLERAEPTELLLRQARADSRRPIPVCNFPYGREVAERAFEIVLKEPSTNLAWNHPRCGMGR